MTRAVERAAQILLALASGTPRLGVSEISEIVDVPKPTVHTMLRTLERHGLVVQEVDGGKYALLRQNRGGCSGARRSATERGSEPKLLADDKS